MQFYPVSPRPVLCPPSSGRKTTEGEEFSLTHSDETSLMYLLLRCESTLSLRSFTAFFGYVYLFLYIFILFFFQISHLYVVWCQMHFFSRHWRGSVFPSELCGESRGAGSSTGAPAGHRRASIVLTAPTLSSWRGTTACWSPGWCQRTEVFTSAAWSTSASPPPSPSHWESWPVRTGTQTQLWVGPKCSTGQRSAVLTGKIVVSIIFSGKTQKYEKSDLK